MISKISQRARKTLALSATALCLWGCQQTASPPPTTPASPSVATSPATSQSPEAKIEDAKALAFGEKLIKDIAAKNFAEVDQAFDYEAFLNECFQDLSIPSEGLEGIKEGFNERLKSTPGGFFAEFSQGRLKVLSLVQEDSGETRLLLRGLLGEGPALTYLELHLREDSDGRIRAYDIYSHATAERISSTIRRLSLPIIANMTATPLEKLVSGSGKEQMKEFQKIVDLLAAAKTGQLAPVEKAFNELSPALQDTKLALLSYLGVLSNGSSNEKYVEILERFRAKFPNDPALYLQEIDYYYLKKDFDKLFSTLDRLERRLGASDPYLDFLRASGHLSTDNLDKAKEFTKKALQAEPDLKEAGELLKALEG